MIISDEDDAQKIKDPPVAVPTVRYPDRAASRRPFSPLPDYETSQALALGAPNDSQVTLYKPPLRRRVLDSRFWRAAIISLLVYIFLTLVVGVPIIIHKEHEEDQKYPNNPPPIVWPKSSAGLYSSSIDNISSPIPPGYIPTCNNWTSIGYLDDTTSLILAVTERYVSANGEFSITSNASYDDDLNLVQGAFFAGINPDQSVQDAVLSIMMQSSSSVFNQTFTCSTIAENFTDVSLYVPDGLTPTDSILYNITLLFPQTAIPPRVDSIATFLPMFDQHFASFDDLVTFDRVYIQGAVSRVTVDSIQAGRILVDTSLEPVTGAFQARSSLLISTVMASIVANISLFNDPNSPFPTTLDVHTGNGNLTANVAVLTTNPNPPIQPNFIANLRTFSGFLSTSFSHEPGSSPAAMQLHVIDDLGPVQVYLDNLFAGIFQVSTKQASASVTQGNASVPDPWVAGLSRTMVVESNSTARVSGWIGWGTIESLWSMSQQGEILIESSLADVALSFLG